MIRKRQIASTGSATRNTSASSALMVNATAVAATSMTGPLHAGRIPPEILFWMFVTSLVIRVTSEEIWK